MFNDQQFSKDLKIQKTNYQYQQNVYNGITNYLIVKIPIQKKMKEVADIFARKVLPIQHLHLSLNDIEHGILRRNARNHLVSNDPILQEMVEAIDYRIHFALNCGATSCPAIAFYSSDAIEKELALAEQLFVNTEFIIDDIAKALTCSEIFKWYRADFGERYLDDVRYRGYEIISVDG